MWYLTARKISGSLTFLNRIKNEIISSISELMTNTSVVVESSQPPAVESMSPR